MNLSWCLKEWHSPRKSEENMLQICNIARKQSPIHFGKDFTVHIYKMDNLGIMTELNPATYYMQQLKGNLNYSIHQSGRGLGSHLFNIVKSMGTSLLKKKQKKTLRQKLDK